MSDERDQNEGAEQAQPPRTEPAEAARQGVPLVGHVLDRTGVMVEKTSRFSREFVATMISLASAAFGVVAALAWNSAITAWFDDIFHNQGSKITALFYYAIIVTLIGVTVIVLLSRLATRINAEPVEFKYPGTPKAH